MSEFLKFAYELLSQVLYNIVQWLAAFVKLLLTGWGEYFLIFRTYFPTLNIPAKILSVLLMLVLIAIPVLIIVLLVRHLIMRHKLKMDKTDNAELYREIGERFAALDSWSAFMITSYEDAEKYMGRKADRNRKIYNGMMKTYFYQFLGPKPPRRNA